MRFWFSPFPLPAAVISELVSMGLEAWPGEQGTPIGPCLLLYDSPDRLIKASEAEDVTWGVQKILTGYTQVLQYAMISKQPLLALWRLQGLNSSGMDLQNWLSGYPPSHQPIAPRPIPSLLASVILSVCDACPQLLDVYNELELCSELLGGHPDLSYRKRLHEAIKMEDPLPHLLSVLRNSDTALPRARKEAELMLNQLNQVQEDLQQLSLAERQKQELLKNREQQCHNLEKELQTLQPRVTHLEQELQSRNAELLDAREEAEITLDQLHQVQEDLQQLFLVERQQQDLLKNRDQQCHNLEKELQTLQPRVTHLEQELQSCNAELLNARKEAELTLNQLHQVQENLQQLFLADLQKQELLRNREQQCHNLEKQLQTLQPRVMHLEQELQSRNAELLNAREEAELTLNQLHQVQVSLQDSFLQASAGRELLQAQTDQLERARRLLSSLVGSSFGALDDRDSVAAEVLPTAITTQAETSSQVQTLLDLYATRLGRATALLARIIRN
jgi:hypothetical protein